MYSDNIWFTLWSLIVALATLFTQLFALLSSWLLLIVWTAWWLWGVNWPRFWEALRRGAWTGLVLLLMVGALVWSRIEPGPGLFVGMELPNFWWQLGNVGLLAAYTFFLGWLQGVMNWTPAEVKLEPAAHAPEDHHAVAHGETHGHVDAHTVTEPTHVDDTPEAKGQAH